MRRRRLQPRHTINHIDRQIEPVNLIQDRQLQRSIDVPLLLVPAHMNVVMVRPPVRELVDQRSICMEIEDHRLILREQAIELPRREPMRMFLLRHQPKHIHHIHKPDLYIRQVLAKQSSGGQGLHRRDIAATGHDHVGLGALVVARPRPDAGALRAVRDRRVDIQVLQVHLLVRNDDVDVVGAAQAMVGDR